MKNLWIEEQKFLCKSRKVLSKIFENVDDANAFLPLPPWKLREGWDSAALLDTEVLLAGEPTCWMHQIASKSPHLVPASSVSV